MRGPCLSVGAGAAGGARGGANADVAGASKPHRDADCGVGCGCAGGGGDDQPSSRTGGTWVVVDGVVP